MEKTIKYLENGEYHYATVKDVGDLAKLKTDSKDDLVTAINELFITGGEAPKKPDGYDELVDNVADAIQKQQQMTDTITNMQQSAQLSDAEMQHIKQVQEEAHQDYIKALKEFNDAIAQANADALELDKKTDELKKNADDLNKKTNDLQDKLNETFTNVGNEVSAVHKQLDTESAGLHKELNDTKTSLEATRKDLLNNTQEFGVVNSEVKELKDKMDRRIWSTDLDPVREQVNKNTTEVSQTKDELKNKADQSSLDLVTNSVENLSTQVKENADGLKVSVKKDELGGDVARLLNDKTNLLLGTRSFSGEDNWKNRDTATIEPGYYKGLKSAAIQSTDSSIYQPYHIKANTAYTFSFFGKEDKDNPKATLIIKPIDAPNINIDNAEQPVHITTEWQRFAVTFSADQDCDISIQIIQGPEASNNILHLAGFKLQYGQNNTPWEPNEADVAENIEHNESQFNVYSDQIAGIVKKQEKMGDTERQLDTRITETAEGLKQTSKDLQDANGKITEFNGKLESTAHGLKTEYEKYTNDAIGQISDSSLNLIRNSAFQNKDDNFAQWQNVSAKANIREDGNGLRWVELTQSGMTTSNPQGITSNYFVVKQGKVTVAVDIKSGDKVELDNESVLFLELYDNAKKRVDFHWVTLSDLGLSKSLLNDHQVHRGLYRLAIDRTDAQYMTVKAHLIRNGDLWFTNFSARLSSIDDGGYTPNPDDVNNQILKMNTKIEEDAQHIALKANSVDVTRDIKSAVDGLQVGGTNLLRGTSSEAISGDAPTTGWKDMGSIYNTSDPLNEKQYVLSFDARGDVDKQIIQTFLWAESLGGHNIVTSSVTSQGDKYYSADGNSYFTLTTQWTRYWVIYNVSPDNTRKQVIVGRRQAQASGKTASGKVYIKSVKLEEGNKSTSWSPAPEDTSAEIKSAKDAAIQVASDQINIHVNEISTSFDDKLNKRVNEVKTASEKFTSDGIEQTVKKITDVKNQVDDIQIGGVNVLHNTDPTNEILSGNITANSWVCASRGNGYGTADPLGAPFNAKRYFRLRGNTQAVKDFNQRPINWKNSKYTFSIYARLDPETGATSVTACIRSFSLKQNKEVFRQDLTVNSKEWKRFTFTFDASTFFSDDTASFAFGIEGVGSIDFAEPMLVTGTKAMDWAPNPDDVSQTMSLDSANIDNLRSQGHYFVKSLTGNPLGSGWVYVDVMGNNNDRIRQDVYQDNGSKHMYRRLFGTAWSGWEQGAYLSDVNAAKTEVTASVKNLGDRVTTEVNSITSKINSNNGGGINLVKKSSFHNIILSQLSPTWAISPRVSIDNGTIKNGAIKIDSQGSSSWSDIQQQISVDPDTDYTFSMHLIWGKADKNFHAHIFMVEYEDDGKTISPYADHSHDIANNAARSANTYTIHTSKNTHSIRLYIRAEAGSMIELEEVKLERGSIATPWSPSPADTDAVIESINTKLDVANGQIQGKVTETQVQDLLNRGHYATQEWSQGQINLTKDQFNVDIKKVTSDLNSQVNEVKTASEKFTSDGIEQTVKKITDVKNQVDGVNDRVNNLKVGTSNLLHHSDTFDGWSRQSTVTISSEKYLNGCIAVLATNGSGSNNLASSLDGPYDDQPVTWTVWAKADNAGDRLHTELWGGGGLTDQPLTTNWKLYKFTGHRNINYHDLFFWGVAGNKGKVYIALPFAVVGNTIGTWTPNPDDVDIKFQYKEVTGSIDFNDLKTQQKIFYKDVHAQNAPAGSNYWYFLNVDVVPGTARIVQTATSDRNNITWKRTFADSWTAWQKQATQGDVDALRTETTASVKNLGDRVTTEVNSITSRVDNLKAGGQNLVADGDASAYGATPWGNTSLRTHLFYYNSTKLMFVIDTSAKTELTAGCPNWFPVKAGHQYTLYFNGFMSTNVSSYDVWLLGKKADAQGGWTNSYPIINGERLAPAHNEIITRTFTVPNDWTNYVAYVRFDNNGSTDGHSAVFFFNEVSLKEGNINTGYSPAPENTVNEIKKLNTKWDVANGQIQGKVTETDVNNILNGKGYATTSTVQSLITQKAGTINESITNLTSEMNTRNGVNLLKGTADFSGNWFRSDDGSWVDDDWRDTYNNRVRKRSDDAWNGLGQTVYLEPGNYTLSLDMFLNLGSGDSLTFYADSQYNGTANIVQVIDGNFYNHNSPQGKWFRAICHFKVIKAGNVSMRPELNQYSGTVHVGSYKLEKGMVTSPVWTPAPSDEATVTQVQQITASIDGLQSTVANKADKSQITQLSDMIQSKVSSSDFNNLRKAVDLQTLDSADINNMKTNGHYFVHNLANNPVGGWVYVDITGNGTDRIRQDVYQDGGNQHKYRRWFGNSWTDWSQGATESEITQLRDDINLRVKSGDLLSQINLTAHNTLIQSNKIYLDSSSTVFSGKAFIPSAAIVNLDAGKINTGTLNTQTVSIGDDQTRLWARSNHLYVTGKDQGDAYNMRICGDKIEFVTTEIPNNAPYLGGITPMYSIEYNGDSKARLKIRSFNRLTGSNEFPIEMYDSINIAKDQLDFAANNHMKMQVVDGGVNVRPTLFFQNNAGNGTWAGFTRYDNSDAVEFNTGNNNGENFHVNSGARFRQYLYVDGWLSCYQLKQTSLLSEKTDIEELDPEEALNMVRQDKQYLYKYKQDVQKGVIDQQAGLIIDDQNETPVYTPPKVFLDSTGKSREPNVELAYLIAAFQELDRRNQKLEQDIRELKGEVIHE